MQAVYLQNLGFNVMDLPGAVRNSNGSVTIPQSSLSSVPVGTNLVVNLSNNQHVVASNSTIASKVCFGSCPTPPGATTKANTGEGKVTNTTTHVTKSVDKTPSAKPTPTPVTQGPVTHVNTPTSKTTIISHTSTPVT